MMQFGCKAITEWFKPDVIQRAESINFDSTLNNMIVNTKSSNILLNQSSEDSDDNDLDFDGPLHPDEFDEDLLVLCLWAMGTKHICPVIAAAGITR